MEPCASQPNTTTGAPGDARQSARSPAVVLTELAAKRPELLSEGEPPQRVRSPLPATLLCLHSRFHPVGPFLRTSNVA